MIALEIDSEIGVFLNWQLVIVQSIVLLVLAFPLLYVWELGLNRFETVPTKD